ncbi:transglycosylase SLT domain-containing protein [Hydrogenophaga sp. 5NK40-0174]
MNKSLLTAPGPLIRRCRTLFGAASIVILAGCSTVAPNAPAPRPAEPVGEPRVNVTRGSESDIPKGPLNQITTATIHSPEVTALTPPADVWERIRRGFKMPDLENDIVRDKEQFYASRHDYMQRMTARSERYLFHIVEEIERRELPMELALLPFIESAFNPEAVSSARAAGMWQFMPATGQHFDLKQNAFRDDRRDVLASTNAALDYLTQLHERFGDWHLALAAYNWGPGNVGRALSRNERANIPLTYQAMEMPRETQHYVPKLQAMKNIVASPVRYGVQLPTIGNHPFFDTIALDRDMDVDVIARLANISEQDFRVLNPSIKQPIVMAAGTPHVLLPWDNIGIFQDNLRHYSGPLASWTAWVAPRTMSVKDAAKSVGMDELELRRANDIPPRMRIRRGSSLLIHRNGKHNGDVPEHVADNGTISLQPDSVLQSTQIRVRRGDTLSGIARRHGISTASLASWNGLSPRSHLKIGQRLKVHLPKSVRLASTSKSSAKRRVSSKSSRKKSTSKRRVPSKVKVK